MIHSSAFVHPDAQLDPSVTVGPYAVLDGPVVVGARTHIHSHAVLSGHVTLGTDNVVGPRGRCGRLAAGSQL